MAAIKHGVLVAGERNRLFQLVNITGIDRMDIVDICVRQNWLDILHHNGDVTIITRSNGSIYSKIEGLNICKISSGWSHTLLLSNDGIAYCITGSSEIKRLRVRNEEKIRNIYCCMNALLCETGIKIFGNNIIHET
jgi:alpha-tubulin suppressor-like RCC1 family protein